MIKYILFALTAILISGCDPKPADQWQVSAPQTVPNTDCITQYVDRGNGTAGFRMVRCPQQTVTVQYSCGKNCIATVATEEHAPTNMTCERNQDSTYTCTPQ